MRVFASLDSKRCQTVYGKQTDGYKELKWKVTECRHLTERRYMLTCKLTTTMLTKGQLLFLIVQYLTKNLSKIRWTLFVQYAAIFNRQKGTHCCREVTCFRDNFHCATLPVRCTNPVVVTNFRPRNMSHEILRSGVRTK